MSFSNNGAGSHFAPSSGEEGHAPYSGVPGHRTPGYGAPGSGTAQRPDDTLQSIYGLPFDSPNGSHATESAPFEPVSSRKPSSPSDTDVFLAVAAQSQGASSQPSLTPAANPVSFATPAPRGAQASSGAPAARQAPAPSASSAATTAAFPASSSGQGAAPANPLVAARTANAGRSAAGNPNGLFPIQEVDQVSGRGFDMSFNETSRKRTVVIAAIVVAVLALAAVGVFFGLRYKQVSDVRGTIDEAIDLLRDTDGVIVPLDEAIASEVSSGVASGTLSDLMLQSTTTSNSLSSADQLVAEAERSRNLLSADDQEALDAVDDSIEARRSMIEIGRSLLEVDTAVAEALSNLEMAYTSIADANANVQSSLDQYNAYMADNSVDGDDMSVVLQFDNNAVASITAAQGYVAAAKEAFPSADLSVLDNYLAVRLNHLNLLLQVDTCVANADWDGANSINDQYVQADLDQQAAAQQVPATAAELLTSAYASTTASQREAYDAARDQCVSADAVLNEYLGITDASKEMGISADGAASQASSTAAPASDVALSDTAAADAAATDAATADPAATDGTADAAAAADGTADPAATDPAAAPAA